MLITTIDRLIPQTAEKLGISEQTVAAIVASQFEDLSNFQRHHRHICFILPGIGRIYVNPNFLYYRVKERVLNLRTKGTKYYNTYLPSICLARRAYSNGLLFARKRGFKKRFGSWHSRDKIFHK